MAKVDILNYISDDNILRSTYDTDTNELNITDVPQNLNSVITLGQGGGSGLTWDDIALNNVPSGDIVLSADRIENTALAYFMGSNTWKLYGNNVTYIDVGICRGDAKLEEAHLPNLETMSAGGGGNQFNGCTALTLLDLGKVASISNNCMQSSTNFDTLILRKSDGLSSLASVNAFSGTKFKSGGDGGTIYIPTVLYDHLGDGSSLDYQYATNWSTVHGYGTITWAKIEGSVYE